MLAARRNRKAVKRYHTLRSEVQNMSPALAGAMLSSLDEMTIVTGQYTDSKGGACPLLAAWRSSKHTVQLEHTFPLVWDVFCGLRSWRQARPATKHEVGILRMLLQERIMPVGERMVGTQPIETLVEAPAEAPALPVHADAQSDIQATKDQEEQWSCDWQAELSELMGTKEHQNSVHTSESSSRSGVAVLLSVETTQKTFLRSRRVAASAEVDIHSPQWASRVQELLAAR